ncbi:MAG: hypothetical protein H6944_00920 [Zoogloeaceae bacterium]|uniref:hypothetical protein n=1 Tax=Denitromonas sp. TaxID=2734609 RepID=UPI001D5C1AEA|nr:hypothetical protein [Rhodocyclaceae bacterium]MCP5220239.1 hypothetical protein [Zoogloeaceae bacterium]
MAIEDVLSRQYGIANDNARQIVSSFLSWYTFFWSLNVAVLTFFYRADNLCDVSLNASYVKTIFCLIFLLLNFFGVGVCYFCWKSVIQLRGDAVSVAEVWIAEQKGSAGARPTTGVFSAGLITYVFSICALSLSLNFAAWGYLPFVDCMRAAVVG